MDLQRTAAIWSPRLLSVLRIIAALLLLQHATAKLFSFPHIASFDNLQLLSLIGVAGILEFIGGILLLLGVFTRPVAFILSARWPSPISSATPIAALSRLKTEAS